MAFLPRQWLLLTLVVAVWAYAATRGSDGWSTLFETQWLTGIDPKIAIQAPHRNSIEVVESPIAGAALQVRIERDDDFALVANGSPRAEIHFAPLFVIARDAVYEISLSTILPNDFRFDTQQEEILAQIHQGPNSGSPPVALLLSGKRYVLDVRGSGKASPRQFDVGDASLDRGRKVLWQLRYRADHDGKESETLLFKDGALVARCVEHCPNAYPDDDQAYLKLGIYKWWWEQRPSDVTERTVFYGPVVVRRRKIQ